MAEKQQDLAKRPVELTRESLQSSEYFSRISLGDIYGRTTLKPGTAIVTDIPNTSTFDHSLFSDHEKLKELAEHYGIPSIGSGSYGGFGTKWQKPFVEITAGMGAPMTNWVPHVFERGAVLALAHSLSKDSQPFVLDVGCGTGLTAKLFAVDGEARVVGIDPRLSKYDLVRETPGNVTLLKANVIDAFGEFAPERKSETARRINEIISQVHDSFKDKAHLYFSAMNHGFELHHADFSREIRELQGLARKNEKSSQVDVVICSFMSTGTDLTLAIRDGIRPKAIVYVMPINGLAGVGNYYFGSLGRDSSVSFNPGRDYNTVARWQTFWEDDWGRVCYDQGLGIEQAEVVVQLRNDVKPKPSKDVPSVRTYPFDEEIVEAIRTGRRWPNFRTDYYQGVMEKITLLKPKRADLPYRRIGV